MVEITLMGEQLQLYPEKALYWPGGRTLFIADPHFGKGALFRHFGIPVPEAPTQSDLDRLRSLLLRTGGERLVILGDFFHGAASHSPATLEAIGRWREEHRQLQVVLVEGNHDRHAGKPPAEWRFEGVLPPWPLPPWICAHEPLLSPNGYVLAGHLHPAVVLRNGFGPGLRAPCFCVGKRRAILPAFGSFTGSARLRPEPGDRLFAVGPAEIIEITK